MKLTDFNYDLPEELIARYPLEKRSASRLLYLNRNTGQITHTHFYELTQLLLPGDLLVWNNSKVIPARLYGYKQTGGRIEILVERILDSKRILAHMRASKPPKPNSLLLFAENIYFKVLQRHDDLYELQAGENKSATEIIETIGEIPLPPYFHRSPEESDKERYQTVYAEHKGSVAAPTAGLHFDKELIENLKQKGINIAEVMLHVGSGTFAPVRVEEISQHRMHKEYIEVNEQTSEKIQATKAQGGRVIAVGTTAARSLETASRSGKIAPFVGDTDIFIYPGYKFQCIDGLITNFHLPASTLLMLVTAFGGYQPVMNAYAEAIKEKYRFFSYGDAMLVL